MTAATNSTGQTIDLDAAAQIMDNDIRETLAAEGIDDPTEFLRRYAEAHKAKFGEEFAPYAGGAW